jgi:hypothetical protein
MANYSGGTNTWPQYPFIDFALTYTTGGIARHERVGVLNNNPGLPGGYGFCNGTLVGKRCSLRSATLDYPVVLVNQTVYLSGKSSDFAVDHVQAVGAPSNYFDYHDIDAGSFTTLGGVAVASQNMFSSSAVQFMGSVKLSGSLACQYADYETRPADFFSTQDACAIN